jgi:ComF family protein
LARHLRDTEVQGIESGLPAPLRLLANGALWAAEWSGRALLDLFLPPRCVACDEPVTAQGLLCAECFRRTGFITEPLCARCGVPFAAAGLGGADHLCPSCRAAPPVFGRARAALRYDAQGRRLILPLKHGDRTELAAALAPLMAHAGAALLRESDLLVPVPLHRARLFHRRYNQAGLLASAVGRIASLPCLLDGLQRRRATASLEKKSAAERAAEVADAFQMRPSRARRVAGKRMLLIDDVLTSGATANACAAVLLAAGAVSVDVLAAARVPDPRLN